MEEETMEVRFNTHPLLDEALNGGFLENLFTTTPATRQYCPAVDISETKETFEVVVEVPGVAKEDMKVSIHQNILGISGKRPTAPDDGKRRIVAEIAHGEFSRKFKLPASIDIERVTTGFSNGVLKITLPKLEQAKVKDIPIQ